MQRLLQEIAGIDFTSFRIDCKLFCSLRQAFDSYLQLDLRDGFLRSLEQCLNDGSVSGVGLVDLLEGVKGGSGDLRESFQGQFFKMAHRSL
jgi:hypothetical protein